MSELTRRQFLKVTGMSLVGSSLALMGFSPGEAIAEVREYKLTRATETRNTCPYCSVACGILMYGLGDGAKNAQPSIFHIEGDPDPRSIAAPCAQRAPASSTSCTARAALGSQSIEPRDRTGGNGSPGMTRSSASANC